MVGRRFSDGLGQCGLVKVLVEALGGLFLSVALALPAFAGQASLAWSPSASSSVTGYKVYYGTASASYSNHLNVGNVVSTTVPNLTAGAIYFFAVTAYNAAGESGYSNEAKATIPASIAAPVAAFTGVPLTGTAPLNASFTSTSSGSITGYAWTFGDGGTANIANPSHTYSAAGTYTVTLNVSGPGGTSSASAIVKASAAGTANLNANDLVIDFGAEGLWQWLNNANWLPHYVGAPAKRIVVADVDHNGRADQIIDFGNTYGIWIRMNGATWKPLHWLSAGWLVKADVDGNGQDDLVADFGSPRGIWIHLNGGGWKQLDPKTAKQAIVADIDHNGRDDVVIDFGATLGVRAYMNGGAGTAPWKQIDARSPTWMTKAVLDASGWDNLVMSFGAGTGAAQTHPGKGVWAYLNGAWRQLDSRAVASTRAVAVDFDRNGQDDLVIDYGTSGLWRYMTGSANPWLQLYNLGSKSLTRADLDSNGQDDLVVDFGAPYGVYVQMNGKGGFVSIHGTPASAIAAGQVDGR